MFNFFKSAKQAIVETITVEPEFTVEMIHADIDSAQDRLLDSARDIIRTNSGAHIDAMAHKHDRLNDLGFSQNPLAGKVKEARKHVSMSGSEAKLIEYYKSTYRFLKFLTEAELDRICKKYGLIHAPVSAYIKDVPDKNIKDIENAQALKESDENGGYIIVTNRYESSVDDYNEFLNKIKCSDGRLTKAKVYELIDADVQHKSIHSHWKREWKNVELWFYWVTQIFLDGRHVFAGTTTVVDYSGLFIAAPPSHFDTKGLEKNGHAFQKITRREVKDPIVFRYVNGGIQVLTKWGTEDDKSSSDEALQNSIDN